MVVTSEARSGFSRSMAAEMDLRVRLAGLRGDEKDRSKPLVYPPRNGASELISFWLMFKYDPIPDRRNCLHPNDKSMEVRLVELRAAAATKPGARRPCLGGKDRSWGRQIGRRIRKDPQNGSRCRTEKSRVK